MIKCLKNTSYNYGIVAKIFHWGLFLAIVGMIAVGFYMASLDPSDDKYALYDLHESSGLLVLILVVSRISWRIFNQSVLPVKDLNKTIILISRIAHFILYIFMLMMPISGIFMSRFSGFDVPFFGLFAIKGLEKCDYLSGIFYKIHVCGIWAFIILICLHVGGAIYHHFIRNDQTLRRMICKVDEK